MNRRNPFFICAGLVLVSCLFLSSSVNSEGQEATGQSMVIQQDSTPPELLEPQLAFPGEFDLEGCEQDCRSKFGVDPYFFGGGGGMDTSVWRLFTICIQDCNRKYWKDYDRRMKKLGDPEKEDE